MEPRPDSVWSVSITCPFPSHKDARERTGSFGYNFATDRFFCFGCHQSGQAVEFIASYTEKTRTSVVEDILAQHGDEEDVALEDNYQEHEDSINLALLDGSKFLQEMIQKHKHNPDALRYIDKLIWWLDFYMMSKAPRIKPNELQARIERAKELLSDEQMFNSR